MTPSPAPSAAADARPTVDERGFRRMLRRATTALIFALGLPILALLALILYLLHWADRVDHTGQVIAQAEHVEKLLITMQSGFRAYLVSGNETHLELYRNAWERLDPKLTELAGMLRDNPAQEQAVTRLGNEAGAWQQAVEAAIAAGSAADEPAAMITRYAPLLQNALDSAEGIIAEEEVIRTHRASVLHRVAIGLLTAIGVAALVGVPALTLWLQGLLRRVAASHRSALEAEQRRAGELEVTLRSIGDAVVATDGEGQVTFLNPVAERLTGWTDGEARGRELSVVFTIFNEETGAPAENPVTRVLRENVVVGLANHTVLRSRAGRETPIEDSAAPIRGDAGEVLGVILVFHDVSERRETDRKLEERARLSTLRAEIAARLDAEEPLARTLQGCCELLVEHVDAAFARVWTLEPAEEALELKASAGLYTHLDGPHARVPMGAFKIGRIAQNRRAHLTNDVAHDPEISDPEWARAAGMQAFAGYPLVADGSVLGVMAMFSRKHLSEAVLGDLQPIADALAQRIQRARVEFALRASETLKSAILNTSLDGFILMDHRGIITDWNTSAASIFGLTREEAVGKALGDTIVPEQLRAAHRQGLERYLSTGKERILNRRLELPAVRRDGSEFSAEISISHVPGTDPALFAGFVRDITERRNAETALRAATDQAEAAALAVAEGADRFRLLAEVVSLQVWTADLDGQLDFANQECFAYFGVESEDEILGSRWTQFVHPDDLEQTAREWQAALASGTRYQAEFRLRWAEGEYRWFLVRAEAMRDAAGATVKWFGTNTDIHDLKTAQAEAERASRAKDNFLAALSHELRTPLTPVLMIAGALRVDERLPADARAQLGVIERNIALEARLIDDLLDLTSIARGKLRLRPQPCDAHSLIGLAVEIVRDDAQAKGIAVRRDLGARQSGLIADPARFQQVIWNLLRNAVKFTPEGGSITIRTRDEEGGRLCIEVTDTGVGIPTEAIEKIFLPFEQAGLEGDHRFGGIGLGLAIARAIVDLHGGTIEAESEGAGKGSTFSVEFPSAMEPPSGATEPSLEDADGGNAVETPPLRLLVVDDHEPTLRVLSRLLSGAGHRVSTANSVSAALAAAESESFDLVISDLGLPDGTGAELMSQLRDLHGLSGIALSGYGMEDDIERSRAAGFRAHLIKPVDFAQLRHTISSVMENTER